MDCSDMLNRRIIPAVLSLLSVVQLLGANPERVQFYYNIAEGNYLIGDRG